MYVINIRPILYFKRKRNPENYKMTPQNWHHEKPALLSSRRQFWTPALDSPEALLKKKQKKTKHEDSWPCTGTESQPLEGATETGKETPRTPRSSYSLKLKEYWQDISRDSETLPFGKFITSFLTSVKKALADHDVKFHVPYCN